MTFVFSQYKKNETKIVIMSNVWIVFKALLQMKAGINFMTVQDTVFALLKT